MKQFIASTYIGHGTLRLYLDNKLVMQNSDSATVELETGKEHIVHWYVEGEAGSSYSITISSPREAEFQLTKALGAGGKDQNGYRFMT